MLNEIKDCRYISSIGMMLSLDDNKMITYDANGVRYDFAKALNGKDGSCIYVKFQYIPEFLNNVFPHIKYRFILVTGDGDETLPNDLCDIHTFISILNNDKIIHWYAANSIECLHPKLTLIPIGVNFHSLTYRTFNKHWGELAQTPLQQEAEIIEIRDSARPFYEREIKCYSNFHFAKYKEFGNPRQSAIDKIDKEIVYYEPETINRRQTWINQSKYAFVLSPIGHGLDCHRTWEALILGCIAVVLSSPLDSLYKGLPVLILNDWSDLNDELLKNTVEKFKEINFDYERITTKYWIDKIKGRTIERNNKIEN